MTIDHGCNHESDDHKSRKVIKLKRGKRGHRGPRGCQGPSGRDGLNGDPGDNGRDGCPGKDGAPAGDCRYLETYTKYNINGIQMIDNDPTATPIILRFDTETHNFGSAFSLDANGVITVLKSGTYEINYHTSIDQENEVDQTFTTRAVAAAYLECDDSTGFVKLPGTTAFLYSRNNDDGECTSGSSNIVVAEAGYKYQVRMVRHDTNDGNPTPNLRTVVDGAALTIKTFCGVEGPTGATGAPGAPAGECNYLEAYAETEQSIPNDGSLVAVDFDSTPMQTGGAFTLNAGGTWTVNEAGTYEIEYHTSIDQDSSGGNSAVNRTTVAACLEMSVDGGVNWTPIIGTKTFMYSRNPTDGESTSGASKIVTPDVGDQYRVVVKRNEMSNLVNPVLITVANGSAFSIKTFCGVSGVDGTNGATGATGATGPPGETGADAENRLGKVYFIGSTSKWQEVNGQNSSSNEQPIQADEPGSLKSIIFSDPRSGNSSAFNDDLTFYIAKLANPTTSTAVPSPSEIMATVTVGAVNVTAPLTINIKATDGGSRTQTVNGIPITSTWTTGAAGLTYIRDDNIALYSETGINGAGIILGL